MFGQGHVPDERYKDIAHDASGFVDVLKLFLRSWPYIRPQVLGRWWYPGQGSEDRVADMIGGDGYQFLYAPLLVAIVAVAGPMAGWVPATWAWPWSLLFAPVVAMVAATALMAWTRGKAQMAGTAALAIAAILANAAANAFIEGYAANVFALLVTAAAIVGWMVQFRLRAGRVEFRVRVASHITYFYVIVFLRRGIDLARAFVLTDLINQNILLGEPLAPALSALFGLPDWTQASVAELTADQRMTLLWYYVYLTVGLELVLIPIDLARDYYNMWIMQRINQSLRLALVTRWHQLSLAYHSGHRTGDAIYRVYQDSAMVTAVIGHLFGMTLALGSYFVCVLIVTAFSPWLGLAAGLLVAPALLWAHWAMPRMRRRTLVYRAATSDVTSTIQESFSAIRLIKAFGTADRAQRRLEEDSAIAFNAAFRVRTLIALVTIVMYTVASGFVALAIYYMATWANRGEPTHSVALLGLLGLSYTVWNLATFSRVRDEFHESTGDIRKLLRDWMTAQDMAMGLRRVFDILDIEPDVQDRPDAVAMTGFEREIRYEDVSFAYEKGRPVLDGVSFAAGAGSITAIIGPTGSGKSTLMAMLLRLFDPRRGAVSIDGRDLRDYQVASVRGNVAVALQENVLFAMSVRDNIRYAAPAASEEQLRTAVRVAAMDEYVANLPQGLDTMLSDRGGKLSSGQRQRLSIARAVVRDTPILILDEPTAALDAATELRVMRNLAEWGKGRAIFLITHRISTIRRADNILYLDAGRIAESGDHDALMRIEGGRYRSFVEAESTLIDAAGPRRQAS